MRSALAYALAAEGLDDRTIIRTIAWWRAQGITWYGRHESLVRFGVSDLLCRVGRCPDEVKS